MSWIDRLDSSLVIITGDGKEYRPLWRNATKDIEYNVAIFEFPNIAGSYVDRGTPMGRKFAVELFFQGEENIEQAREFELSTYDRNPWTVLHPLYDKIIVHPLGLRFDNSALNVTIVTGLLIETISKSYPQSSISPIDQINRSKTTLDELFNDSFDVVPNASDVNTLKSTNEACYKTGSKTVKDGIDAENYFNAFNRANSAIINATADPLMAMRQLQAVINTPAMFANSVKQRVSLLSSQFISLTTSIATISSRSGKKIYENNAGNLMSAQALAAANPLESDYANRTEVIEIADTLMLNYRAYIAALDELQTPNGGEPDSFIPDAAALSTLASLIKYTLTNLFHIAMGAKQERTIYLEKDSNLILVTHRVLGLDDLDQNMNTLMDNNNIGLNEIFQLKKGRKIVYYV